MSPHLLRWDRNQFSSGLCHRFEQQYIEFRIRIFGITIGVANFRILEGSCKFGSIDTQVTVPDFHHVTFMCIRQSLNVRTPSSFEVHLRNLNKVFLNSIGNYNLLSVCNLTVGFQPSKLTIRVRIPADAYFTFSQQQQCRLLY